MIIIVGNPPYSSGQANFHEQNPKDEYPAIDKRIRETYVRAAAAYCNNTVHDSYIRAIRWASDRIGREGIIGFVTNGSFIWSESATGVRACIESEFT